MKTTKTVKVAIGDKPKSQYGVLPWRRSDGIEIMLVTSRETKRWVAPKGWPMKGLRPHAAAAREAFEEAGIRGKVSKTAIGVYGYVKRLKSGSIQTCKVKMFPLKVTEELDSWPERNERDRKWFSLNEAMKAVNEPDLRRIIHAFEQARTKSKNDKTRRAKDEESPDAASHSISTS